MPLTEICSSHLTSGPLPQADVARTRRTLILSILEGVGYAFMVGAGETYFVPYALFLGGSNLVLGLFVALPIMVGSLSQVFSERLRRALGTRKRAICACVAGQVLAFVPIVGIHALDTPYRPHLLLAAVCLYWAAGLLPGPSWSSLMGDLVAEDHRGAYFGRRSRFMQIATFAGLIAAGLILFELKRRGQELLGFTCVFGLAATARLASLVLLLFHWEPPMESPPTRRAMASVGDTLRNREQRVLILYLALMSFGVYLAAPFFSAFMLRPNEQGGLAWSYVAYTSVNGITFLFKFLFLPLWGSASDRFGSRKCLVLAAWLVCGLPLVWLCPRSNAGVYFAMICLVQMFGGLAWAGHELCSFNFLLDSARPPDRPGLVASMNMVNGVMVFLGSLTGSLVVSLAPGAVSPFLLVFCLSGLTRILVCSVFVRRLKEVRVVEAISYRSLLFRVSSPRANLGPVLRFFVLPLRRTRAHAPAPAST